jgi:hypothetical protein
MSNIVLELREKDSLNVNRENGHYIAHLSQEISINQGDTISLKQAFIDTTDESPQNITIDKDITLIFNYCPYTMDWRSDRGDYLTNTGATTSSRRGRPRLPYKRIPPELIPNYSFVNNVEFDYYSALPVGKGLDSTSYQASFLYINTLGQRQYLPLTIPQLSDPKQKKPNFPSKIVFNPNIIAKNGTFQLASPPLSDQFLNGAVYASGKTTFIPAQQTQTQYKPYEMRWEIPISAGTYNINDLLLTISKNLSQNDFDYKTPNTNVLRNPVLFKATLIAEGAFQPDESLIKRQNVNNPNVPNPTQITEPVLFCEAFDGTTIPTAQLFTSQLDNLNFIENDWFFGTNQVQFSFNQQTGKCEMNYLHMPIYSTTGGDISCRYIWLPDLAPGSQGNLGLITCVPSNGGICFTGLAAEDADGNYIDFFENTLGFDLQSLLVQFAPPIPDLFGKIECQFIPFIPLIEGQNITTGYVGTDSLVRKTGKTDLWLACPKGGEGNPPSDIPILNEGYQSTIDADTTVKIEAVEQLAVLLSDFSHFLIDIKSNFMTDLIGSNYFRTINGIVSKYQSYTSFTYGESDGAITYTHQGNSVLLKSLEIKILKSDKTSASSEIGNDNTVYLQIIKN